MNFRKSKRWVSTKQYRRMVNLQTKLYSKWSKQWNISLSSILPQNELELCQTIFHYALVLEKLWWYKSSPSYLSFWWYKSKPLFDLILVFLINKHSFFVNFLSTRLIFFETNFSKKINSYLSECHHHRSEMKIDIMFHRQLFAY